MQKMSIYNANPTMRLIGYQGVSYVYYNNGLEKLNEVLIAHSKTDEKRKKGAKDLMIDTYIIGFIQGMKYARQKAKQPHTRCKVI